MEGGPGAVREPRGSPGRDQVRGTEHFPGQPGHARGESDSHRELANR